MKITLDEERSRLLNAAFDAARAREGAARDEELLAQEEPDEKIRRLVQAQGQLDQARLCFWGLPSQAVIWGYQGIDNAIHAALLAKHITPSRIHPKKLKAFEAAFHSEGELSQRLVDALELWTAVRYERSAVSRETGQRLVELAEDTFRRCCHEVAQLIGKDDVELYQRLASIADRIRIPAVTRSEGAIQNIEMQSVSQESRLEGMGLSGAAAQSSHGGRDIWIEMVADQPWARTAIEDDQGIAEEIAALHGSFHKIVTMIIARRTEEKIESDPDVLAKAEEVVSLADFNLSCVISYAGLSTLTTMLRMMAATRESH